MDKKYIKLLLFIGNLILHVKHLKYPQTIIINKVKNQWDIRSTCYDFKMKGSCVEGAVPNSRCDDSELSMGALTQSVNWSTDGLII